MSCCAHLWLRRPLLDPLNQALDVTCWLHKQNPALCAQLLGCQNSAACRWLVGHEAGGGHRSSEGVAEGNLWLLVRFHGLYRVQQMLLWVPVRLLLCPLMLAQGLL